MPSESSSAPFPNSSQRRIWPWIVLATILVAYAVTIVWLAPAANFGSLQDDAMYFSSAKALAAGQGYVLPSFPGKLDHSKYPELYPWLLSWIWRLDPKFPANVVPAIGITVFFAWWFLIACYLVARRTFGLSPGWALLVTAFCAFNFFALLLGGSVLSDLPFGALALTAALCADRALEPVAPATTGGPFIKPAPPSKKLAGRGRHWGWMAAAGVLAGLATGLRTVGVTVVAGIALVALARRAWRRAALICVVGGGFALPWVLPSILRVLTARSSSAALPIGWSQTLAFYTSYVGQWRHFVPNWTTQWAVLWKNGLSMALEPGVFLLFPLGSRSAAISVGAGSALALGAWTGIALGLRRSGWKSIHSIFLCYLAMVLPWPFPPERFLVPFLPLVVGGAVLAFREIARWPAGLLRQRRPIIEQAVAGTAGVVVLSLAGLAAANCAYLAPAKLARLMAERRVALAEKREAYRWITGHTPKDARVIAYDDVLLYLYTGRQAIRPIAPSTASSYDDNPAIAEADAAHLGDVAHYVHAEYWVVTPADFDLDLGDDATILKRRENEHLAPLPVVFRSDGGRVRIYDLRCFQTPNAAGRQKSASQGCPSPAWTER